MAKKNRAYKRGAPFRDASLFVIACEGAKREKDYFEYFQQFSQQIKIEVLAADKSNKSAPQYVLERAEKYVEEQKLNEEDVVWLVLDVDRWGIEKLREIGEICLRKNWGIAISNPCFEVWLYAHISELENFKGEECKDWKNELHKLTHSGFKVDKFAELIHKAVERSLQADNNVGYFFPQSGSTKLYLLAIDMLKKVKM